ncbi:MAG: tetratricopeptide repeat-containing sensor histidine kinase [Chitinophagaceae bacterium]|nr:tetratricopeptide repeat-containing sensor histidine kinase [Chitinophagaceae bacterium]
MKRLIWIVVYLHAAGMVFGQATEEAKLDSLYDYALNLPVEKFDSISYWAQTIQQEFKGLKNTTAYFHRLKGISFDEQNQRDSAVQHFLWAMSAAKEVSFKKLEASLNIDMGLIHVKSKEYESAIKFFNDALVINERIQNLKGVTSSYNNLGIIYRKLNQPDKAISYYQRSLKIKQSLGDERGVATVNNNIGALFLETSRPDKALPYFKVNVSIHRDQSDRSTLFTDYSNMAAAYLSLHDRPHYLLYIDSAGVIQHELKSSFLEITLKKIYMADAVDLGNYKKAFEISQELFKLEHEFVNEEASKSTAEMQEKFNAVQREKDNKLLQSRIFQKELEKRNLIIGLVSLLLVISLLIAFLWQRHKKNRLLEQSHAQIHKQYQKLSELNYEKNSLLSIVSHDLSMPFANIKLWNSVLQSESSGLNEEKKKAILRISEATQHGEEMIKKILDVERIFAVEAKQLVLKEIDLVAMTQRVIESFEQYCAQKSITIDACYTLPVIQVLADQTYLWRILENLLSNAIKFSNSSKHIEVVIHEQAGTKILTIRDYGVGIAQEELPLLFTKYGRINSRPTAGEPSTGLGLSIVKKLADELGIRIEVKSVKGEGTSISLWFSPL